MNGTQHRLTGQVGLFIQALIQFTCDGTFASYDALATEVGTHQADKISAVHTLASKARKVIGDIIEKHYDNDQKLDGYSLQCDVWVEAELPLVTRVTDWTTDTAVFSSLSRLYEERIPVEDQHELGALYRWIDEYQREASDSDYPFVGYLFIARLRHRLVGFVFAEYHKPSGYLLINWLVRVRDRDGDFVTEELLKNLLTTIAKEQLPLRLVAYEFTNRIDARMTWNNGIANYLGCRLTGQNVFPRKLPVEYVQPGLSLPEAGGQSNERKGILVYVPIDPPAPTQSHADVKRILDVICEWYQSTFDFDDDSMESMAELEQYSKYVRRVFDRIMSSCAI